MDDLSNFLKGSVADLDWLNVDEAAYRQLDRLPKQNLDISPDLVAAWSHEDRPASAYVPNRGDAPRTMADLGPGGPVRPRAEDIVKVARLAMMQSPDPERLRHTLVQRFGLEPLREARSVLATVLAERGLLGRYYIDAADFPGCGSGSAKAAAFVKKHAHEARFVVAKPECRGCIHAHETQGGQTCSVFHKQIEVDVPYTEALADQVERLEEGKGRQIQASTAPPKDRIRLALLAPAAVQLRPAAFRPVENVQRLLRSSDEGGDIVVPIDLTPLRDQARGVITAALQSGRLPVAEAQAAFRLVAQAATAEEIADVRQRAADGQTMAAPVYRGAGNAPPLAAPVAPERVEAGLVAASNLTRKRDEEMQRVAAAERARPIVAQLQRAMLKGRPEAELVATLRQVASPVDLKATQAHWEPLLREAGLYGVIYTTQASFEDCREGASFLAAHNPGVKAVVAGDKCKGCIYNKIGRCLTYGKPLVATADALYTPEMVATVFQDHKMAGRIAPWDTRLAQAPTPRAALQNLHRAAATKAEPSRAAARTDLYTAFVGQGPAHTTRTDTRRQIVTAARRYLNEGLYGQDLGRALKAQFDVRDIQAARDELKVAMGEQGLQGVYFVDPTVYEDYGKGCKEASRLHRTRQVPYVKASGKCGSCVHQATPGHCSVLNKALVSEVPYPTDRAALQREILASGPAISHDVRTLVNNGMAMMAEYDLQHRNMEVAVEDKTAGPDPLAVSFADGGLRL